MQDTVRAIGRWFADLPGGRRSKFAVVGVWLVVLFVIGPLAGKFEDVQENDPADYLPAKAESVQAIEELEDFPSGDISEAITVFNREGGLTEADRAAIVQTRAAINSDRREGVGETGPPDPLRGRRLGAADHPDHHRGRKQRGRGATGGCHRRHQGRSRGAALRSRGEGDRARGLLRRRDRRLRLHQRHPAVRHRRRWS